jgi:hypothetical protein
MRVPLIFAEWMNKVVKYFASTELAVTLLLVISLVAIPGTFSENRTIYSSPLFLLLLGLFGINLILCTLRRFKTISRPVLVLHGGIIVTLVGCILATFGFVATVNLYEGTMADHVYRWDLKKDAPLGVDMLLKKINWEFYPMPVKIGVLRGQKKEKLFELKTGQSFDFNGYRIDVGPVEYNSENLKLSVFKENRMLGTFNTLSGSSDLPSDFPYSFKLVAFKTPRLKRQWVDLVLTDTAGVVSEGTAEVNGPFKWKGLYFFNTQIDEDKDGVQFAGIQIVQDPGRWLVFLGMTIVAIGAFMATFRRLYGVR